MNKTKAASKPETAAKKPLFLAVSQSAWVKFFICLQLLLLAVQFTPDLSTNGDDARYYLLGKSLHDGQGYRQIQHPSKPIENIYPMVFPIMLAIVHFISSSIMLAKIAQGILGALVTLLAFYLFKVYSKSLILPMIALCATCATLSQFGASLMSEIPYLFFSLLALLLYEKSIADPKKAWLFWLTIFISIFPMHCRSVGLAFSVSWVLATFISKKYRYMFAHIAVLAVSVFIYHKLTTWDNSYVVLILQRNTYNPELGLATPAELVTRVFQNIQEYSTHIIQRSLIPFEGPPALIVLTSISCVALIFVGWLRSMFGPMKVLSLYTCVYFGILLMWQTQWSSERFVAGIIPFLYFFLLQGVETLLTLAFGKREKSLKETLTALIATNREAPLSSKGIVWALTVLLCLSNIVFQINFSKTLKSLGPDWKNFYSCADWMRNNTPKSTVVMNRKVELFYVRSQRQGVMYPYSHDVNNVMKVIDTSGVDYVVFDNFYWTSTTRQYLYPAIEAFPNRFQMVYALNNPPTAIYKVVKQ